MTSPTERMKQICKRLDELYNKTPMTPEETKEYVHLEEEYWALWVIEPTEKWKYYKRRREENLG